MRKVRIIGAAFFAVLAFGVISASASAAPEWYKNGAKLTVKEEAVTKGTWTLEGLGIFGIKLKVECNGELVGTVGPGGADEITEVKDLTGKTLLDCKLVEKALCETGTLALVEAEKLNWTSALETSGTGVIDKFGTAAFDVRCLLSGGSWSLELCEGPSNSDLLVNLSDGTVDGEVLKANSTKCNNSSNTAHTSANGKTSLVHGGTLEAK